MFFNREEPPSGSVNKPLLLLLLSSVHGAEVAQGKKNERAICPKDKQVFSSPGICKLGICPFSVLLMWCVSSKTVTAH